jgi:uncharacterized SAM-binding protein YcdF (DUF218 family)
MAFFTESVALLSLPPAGPLLLMIVGAILLRRKHARLGWAIGLAGFAALWLASLGVVGMSLLRSLESAPAAEKDLAGAAAIVVLGGGLVHDSPEYREDIVGAETLQRLRYAARLARASGIPVLVTGGNPHGGNLSEGEAMARILRQDFQVLARWIEDRSATTAENASHSFEILRPQGRTRIVLVTSAGHMPRAQRAFSKAGFAVIPAPTGYLPRRDLTITAWLPSADGLYATRTALRELLGIAWYRLTGAA